MTIRRVGLLVPFLVACGSSGDPGQEPGAVDGAPNVGDSGSNEGGDGDGDGDGNGEGDGDGDDGAEEYISGSRIKARVATTPDGAKALVGWHDTQLGIDCNFYGRPQARCVPFNVAIVGAYYLDAGCTERLAYTGATNCASAQPKYGGESTSTCESLYTYYEITPTTPSEVYVLNGNGDCIPQPANDALAYYTVGAEVSLNTFQSATISLE